MVQTKQLQTFTGCLIEISTGGVSETDTEIIATPQESDVDTLSDAQDPPSETIDPNGDLLLEDGSYTILVSSSVLSLSSAYFRNLLDERQEDYAERSGKQAYRRVTLKPLGDDNLEAFRIVCQLLHFQQAVEPRTSKRIAAVADICYMYNCEKAILPHVQTWTNKWNYKKSTTTDLKYLLWVAWVFDMDTLFRTTSRHLATDTEQDELERLEISLMPQKIFDDIKHLRSDEFYNICDTIEKGISDLQKADVKVACTTSWICEVCDGRISDSGMKCLKCGMYDSSIDTVCRNATRQVWFMQWLEQIKCWPISKQRHRSCRSISKMSGKKMSSVPKKVSAVPGYLEHNCKDDGICPLEKAKARFINDMDSICVKAAGLDINDYRE